MEKSKIMMIVHLVIAAISLYVFLVPNIFGSHGYSLAKDGIVVARGLCLIFSMYNVGQAIKSNLGND